MAQHWSDLCNFYSKVTLCIRIFLVIFGGLYIASENVPATCTRSEDSDQTARFAQSDQNLHWAHFG